MSKSALFAVQKHNICPRCGAELVMRTGKAGPFWGCSHFPACDYIHSLHLRMEGRIIKILEEQFCPECQAKLALRQGRYGMFIGCSRYPECGHTEIIDRPDRTMLACPQCVTGKLVQRRSRFGKSFHACDRYPDCQFTVNFTPVGGICAFCHFPLLIEKKTTTGKKWICASKVCGKPVASGKA